MLIIGHSIPPHIKIILTHPTKQTLPIALPPNALQPIPSIILYLQQAINQHKGNPCISHLYQSINVTVQHRDRIKDWLDIVCDYHE